MLHTCFVFLVLPPTLSPFLYPVSQLVWNAVSAFLGSSLFCFPPCLPSCFAAGLVFQLVFSILLPAGSGMLWPIPWAPPFFCVLLPGISLDPLLQSAGGETCSSRMPRKMPSHHVFCHVLSLEVTLVMSCRAPQFEERSIWCMIGSSHE